MNLNNCNYLENQQTHGFTDYLPADDALQKRQACLFDSLRQLDMLYNY
jgi:hypothetical protein